MKSDIEQLLYDHHGVIRRRDHPDLIQRLDRLRAAGELVALLPGVLATPAGAEEWSVRLRAGLLWAGPDAVVIRHAAARLSFWPSCPAEEISLSLRNPPRPRGGWQTRNAAIPVQLRRYRAGLMISDPSYTAVDLAADHDGGEAIDRALRERQATLPRMWQALDAMPGRRGNRTRRALLRDSRDAPWSELERIGHRLLRSRRITGWRTNVRIRTRSGDCYADVLFPGSRVIVEFDGWEFHHDREAFENDRRRRNDLTIAGYTVLNFTWMQVVDEPDWVIGCVELALRQRTR